MKGQVLFVIIRLLHLRIKHKVAAIAPVDVAVTSEQSFFTENHAYKSLENTAQSLSPSFL